MGFPGGLGGKESVCNVGDLGWEDPLEHGNPLQYSCLENPHGQRSLVDYSPWGCKESGTTEHLSTAQRIHFCMRVWSVQPHGLYSTRLLCPWVSPGRNTGVGCHFLLQGIFLTQGSNPHLVCLQHWQAHFFTAEPPGEAPEIDIHTKDDGDK